MGLYEIKERILELKGVEFTRFENWFFKFGCDRIRKNAKTSKIRQAVLKLSDKDLDLFWEWYEDLCQERWTEEVQNDPIARRYLEIGYMIMGKPDPDQFLVDLLSGKSEGKAKRDVDENRHFTVGKDMIKGDYATASETGCTRSSSSRKGARD